MMIPCDLLLPGLDTNEVHESISKTSVGIDPLSATDRHCLVPKSSKVEGMTAESWLQKSCRTG
jgi:hypothetical protein